jgi:hypothetical protein
VRHRDLHMVELRLQSPLSLLLGFTGVQVAAKRREALDCLAL